MEIKLITGATAFEACVNTLKQIDYKNLEQENMVVVPDSFSMQAEKLIFDVLKIKSTFNIKVVGISRLASEILRENNIAYDRVGSLEEVFCIFKAVKECEANFKYFNKCGVDFCLKILQIIKQFKACKLKPENIKPTGEQILDNKMSDLKVIFERFEELLGDKLDLSKLLEFFVEKAEKNLNLKNINLFFVNFDSFTQEISSFICKLSGYVNKVMIGMAKPISPNNAFIYEDDIIRKITKISKEYGVSVQVENIPTSLTGNRLRLVENLFAFAPKSGKSDYFVNILAKNKQDEIEFVAKYIKNQIVAGKRFKDFAVAVADKTYFDLIKTTFAQFDIACYCDDAVNLSQTILGRFLLKILNFAKVGTSKECFEYLMFLVDEDERKKGLTEIDYYNIDENEEFLAHFPEFEKVLGLIENLKNCRTTTEFSSLLKSFLSLVEEKFNNLLEKMQNENYFKLHSENLQSKELIEQVLDKLSILGQDEKIEIYDFENLFLLSLQSVKVETIPAYVDAVYVGDATESYFEDVDTLFVLGATANNLPKSYNDTAIIDDEDIKKLRINFAFEPEVRVLNRRNRLKLFECLQHALEKLFVCCPLSEENKLVFPANFVGDLKVIFGDNVLHTASLEDVNLPILSKDERLNKLLFYIGNQNNLTNAYSTLKAKKKLPYMFESSLFSLIKKSLFEDDKKDVVKIENVTKNKRISASQLEKYFACPFRHFLNYTLKIKQKENIEPNKRLFGNFQHTLLQKFVETNIENLAKVDEKQIDQFLNENVNVLAKTVYDENVCKKEYFINFLKKESKIILKNVVFEQKCSDFRPIMLEEKICDEFFDDVALIGFVDRVDKCENYFRIIDYKTGKTQNIKKDLFYGKKLQLFLYARAIKQKTKLECAGVYYFDCQTKFGKLNKNSNLLNGLTLKDNDVVYKTDKTLYNAEKSNLIGVSPKVKFKNGEFGFKYGNVESDFDVLFDYANEISKLAIKEIENGYISAKPFENECEFCPYISICKHTDIEGFRKMQKVGGNLKEKTDEN